VNPEHHRRLERMYLGAPCNVPLGLQIAISHERAEVRLPVHGDLFHAAHAVHGSYYFKLLDDAAFFAANSVVPDVFVLTVSFQVQLLRPVTAGTMVSEGRVVRAGRELIFAESTVRDDAGRELGRGSGVFSRSRIALGPEVGYA